MFEQAFRNVDDILRKEADAVADLGAPEEIGAMFAGFQKYLYEPRVAG